MFGWMGLGSGWAEQEQQREAARQHTSDELELDRVVVHSLAASLINQSINRARASGYPASLRSRSREIYTRFPLSPAMLRSLVRLSGNGSAFHGARHMSTRAEQVRQRLAALAPSHVHVTDSNGTVKLAHRHHTRSASPHRSLDVEGCDGGHMEIVVHSAQFAGKPLLAQHRMVNELIADLTRNVHAVSIVTKNSAPTS